MNSESDVTVRPVETSDRDPVLRLIEPQVAQRKLLKRTFDEVDELLRNGFVAEYKGQIVGFAALEIYSKKLAEVRSLVVADGVQGRGVGRLLVASCVNVAREQDILEVMAISSAETFFRACGFDFTLPDEKKAFFFTIRER